MSNSFISIGEAVHASIPKTGTMMKRLVELGPDAYSKPSEPLNYIKALIESQAAEGADYIEVNLDAFGEDDPQKVVDMMVEYVRMVRKWGGGVPICIDSSSDNVLTAGLKEWFNPAPPRGGINTDLPPRLASRDAEAGEKVAQPLVNSIKVYTMDNMLPLKKDYDYAFVGLLMAESASPTIDEMYSVAKQIFKEATGKYGFKPGEIFFDPTIFPLAIDMPMEPGQQSYTYRAFETIRKIKNDPEMKGVHLTGGITNCVRDLPGRKIGVCRAYVAKAMEYGLDSGIVNVSHHYGTSEAAPDLLELVEAYAKMDGSAERMNKAMTLMAKFCRESRKSS
jgi:5-methyltetrahydrofolate corrinoid/iron sulfur protein methyltransferase